MSINSSKSNMRLGTKVIVGLIIIVVVIAISSYFLISPDFSLKRNLAGILIIFSTAVVVGTIAVNSTIKQLNAVIESLRETSENIMMSSALASDSSQRLAEGSAEQSASVQETSATMEETSSLIQQTTQNTKVAVNLAENAKKEADGGLVSVENLLDSMHKLGKSSEQVQKVIKVIDGIAFQTNILSLNAAVEAARAGDVGKGFAVVAEEVRNLAQRSAQAAKETAALIDGNVNLTKTAVEVSEKVGDELNRIDISVSKVKDLLDEVSTASQEQVIATGQITQAITQIDQVVQMQSGIAAASANDSRNLVEYCDKLKGVMVKLIGLIRDPSKAQPNKPGNVKKLETKKSAGSNKSGNTRRLENKTSGAPRLTSNKSSKVEKRRGEEKQSTGTNQLTGASVVNPEDVIPLGDF